MYKRQLYKVTKGEAFVASDVGQHQMFAALYYPFAKPRQWINSGGLGTMGFGIPAAMGAQFANPDAVVCCVTGDGSVQMNIQELSTCMQYGVPIKIISINNRALGMVKQWQKMFYGGRHSHSYMESLPDFVKLAEAYGHVGIAVSDPAELERDVYKRQSLQRTNVGEAAGDGGGGGHGRAHQVGATGTTLTPLEVAVAGGGAALPRLQPVVVHGQTHGAAGQTPLKACLDEDLVQPLSLGLGLHLLGAR